MTKKTKLILSIVIPLIIFIGFLFNSLFLDGNGVHTLISFLFMICSTNYAFSKVEKDNWNNGICKDSNKPWEFSEAVDFSDGSVSFYFKSDDKIFSSQFLSYERMKNEYNGVKQF